MNYKKIISGLLAAGCLLVAAQSQAVTVSWQLDNVVLSDGQTVTGGFDYGADTNSYSNISIVNSGTGGMASQVFSSSDPARCYPSECRFDTEPQGSIYMLLRLNGEMTNLGGTITLSRYLLEDNPSFGTLPLLWNTGSNVGINGSAPLSGSIIGTVVPSSVPVPAAAWLFGSALLGLAGVRRRGGAA